MRVAVPSDGGFEGNAVPLNKASGISGCPDRARWHKGGKGHTARGGYHKGNRKRRSGAPHSPRDSRRGRGKAFKPRDKNPHRGPGKGNGRPELGHERGHTGGPQCFCQGDDVHGTGSVRALEILEAQRQFHRLLRYHVHWIDQWDV